METTQIPITNPYRDGAVRVSSSSGGELVVSTSSSDITVTEEHVTVHARREPLPWSMRKTPYDKPLPGLGEGGSRGSDLSSGGEDQINDLEGLDLRPTSSPIQKSPDLYRQSVPSSKGITDSLKKTTSPVNLMARSVGAGGSTFPTVGPILGVTSPVGSTSASSISWLVAGPKGKPVHTANDVSNQGEPLPLHVFSPSTASQTSIPVQKQSPRLIHEDSPTLVPSQPLSQHQPAVTSPSSLALGNDSSADLSPSKSPIAPIASPQPIPLSYFNTGKVHSPSTIERVASPVSTHLISSSRLPIHEPSPSLSALEAGLSPKGKIVSPTAVGVQSPVLAREGANSPADTKLLDLIESGLSPLTGKERPPPVAAEPLMRAQPNLGEKREHISSPAQSPILPEQKLARHYRQHQASKLASKSVSSTSQLTKSSQKYRKDWKAQRKVPVETFFYPPLFNPERLQYLHIPRKRRPIPREYRQVAEDVDPGARYRRDWQTQRRYNVADFFNPQLFDEGHLQRVKIPLSRRQKRRQYLEKMQSLGLKSEADPGSILRHHWVTSRAHPVESFFEPSLFNSNKTAFESLREDCYVLRKYPSDQFHNAYLLSEAYQRRRAPKSHFMIQRLLSDNPIKYRSRPRHDRDPGLKYRRDWQVTRLHQVDTYFDPSLFDEEKAQQEAPYWHKVIAHLTGRPSPKSIEVNSPQAEQLLHVAIPIVPASPTLLVSKPSPLYRQPAPVLPAVTAPAIPASNVHELLEKLRMDLGHRNPRSKSYDWAFWEALFRGELDPQEGKQRVLEHLTGEEYAAVPIELLPFLWLQLAGVQANSAIHEQYAQALSMATFQDNHDTVEKQLKILQQKYDISDQEVERLTLLLCAYSVQDPDFVDFYMLGLWALPLVRSGMSEEDAFGTLSSIMLVNQQRYNHLDDYNEMLFDFEALLQELDPALTAHLQYHGVVPELYAHHWFSTLFSGFPAELHARTYTALLAEGPVALHKLALVTMVENRDQLLDAQTFPDIMAILCTNGVELIEGSHPDWKAKDWLELTRCLNLTPDQLEDLHYLYEMQQQQNHVKNYNQIMEQVEAEDDWLIGQVAWLHNQIHQLTQERKYLCLELMEWRCGCERHRKLIGLQTKEVQELRIKMGQLVDEHNDEIERLTNLLTAQSYGASSERKGPERLQNI